MTPTLWQKVKRIWKSLDESEREEWKSWVKTQHFKKLRAWHLVPSLHGKYLGKQWKRWQTLFWGAPKSLQMVTTAVKLKDTCSLEEKLWPTWTASILKSRDNTLPTKVHLVKAMVFPVVMYGCESRTIKKAECKRIAFELWCWGRLLKVPWTERRSNQSILKEISPECSLEGLMLKLKLQYFGHLIWRIDSLEMTLMLAKFEGRRNRRR